MQDFPTDLDYSRPTRMAARSTACPAARRRGFTLIELLVVLVILGLLIGFAGPRVINYLGGAKSDAAKVQIQALVGALDLFRLDVGRYPSDDEGLQVLVGPSANLAGWNGPYINKSTVPLDPWGQPYRYESPKDGSGLVISSLGADAREGGAGEDQDIRND